MELFNFEKNILIFQKGNSMKLSDDAINEKYEKGEARIITEQGAIKLSLVTGVFNSANYQLKPKYQRRITWDSQKLPRSSSSLANAVLTSFMISGVSGAPAHSTTWMPGSTKCNA